MKTAIICLSERGYELAHKIASSPLWGDLPAGQAGGWGEGQIFLPEKVYKNVGERFIPSRETTYKHKTCPYKFPLKDLIKSIFNKYDALVFVMALGIVVREIAPLIKDKSSDPAVITIDEKAQFCISTLGGHEAGANKLAREIAKITGAKEVITTASEGSKIVLGIGLKKNKAVEEIKTAILLALQKKNMDHSQIKEILTIDIKKEDQALINACQELSIPLKFVSAEEINTLDASFETSDFVIASIGAKGVCEPVALIGSDNKQLIMKKTAFNGITIALAR